MISLIPYIGGKHRIAKIIAEHLRATGADVLVDVFGGSAAVLLNAGFKKRIYNDLNEDLVCLFRVLSVPVLRRALFLRLRSLPMSRAIFLRDSYEYIRDGYSFQNCRDQVGRAEKIFYRQQFCFGGKGRSGGFSVSTGDRNGIKELVRYRNTLRRLAKIGEFFRETVIECLNFDTCIRLYGKTNVVLFCDPPYVGTEDYYARNFGPTSHALLANMLHTTAAKVVCTYYDCELVRELYPETRWTWIPIQATKNSQFRGKNKARSQEMLLVKKEVGV